MHYSFSILKSYGTTATAASFTSIDSTIAYSAGAGVAIVDTAQRDEFSFRVCAPKQMKSRTNTTQLGSMNADSKASLRINQTSCLALCDRFVALGETGHCPRVVILDRFSSAVIAIIQEHQFGVHLLKFSPSGDLLATLGTPNDGYLYVWNTAGKVCIKVSNRCISEVSDLCWLSETVLVTAGVRHLRVWTVGEGTVLNGRNIVLGDVANSRFTSVLRKSDTEFYAGNEIGQVFLVSDGHLQLHVETGERVRSLSNYQSQILAAGPHSIKFYNDQHLAREQSQSSEAVITAGEAALYLQSGSINELGTNKSISGTCFTGVCPSMQGFVAWNSDTIAYFDNTGKEISRDTLQAPSSIAFGDQPELMQAFDDGRVQIGLHEFIAHEVEGAGISLHAKLGWAVSAGRDNLQIYKFGESSAESGNESSSSASVTQWQTLSMHGRVTRAKVVDQNTIIATITNKVINIITADANKTFSVAKSIPLTSPIQDFTSHNSKLYVSTLDKKLTTYDLEGNVIDTVQTLDMLGEPVIVNSLNILEQDQRVLVIASASDKSIVLYEGGELLACQWAHSEIPKVTVIGNTVTSVASDGMFIYRLVQEVQSPARPSSPVRIVREARSPSPVRRPKTILRSPEKQASSTRPTERFSERLPPRSPTRSPVRPRSPIKPDSLKLAPPPKFDLQPVGASVAVPSEQPRQDQTLLATKLKEYIDSGNIDESLFPLLAKAMEKTPQQALGHYSKRLAQHFNSGSS